MTADLHAAALAALEARRALIEAGTPGPWEAWERSSGFWWIEQPGRSDIADLHVDGRPAPDAALIVAMHADYSRWLEALEHVLVRHAPTDYYGKTFCADHFRGVLFDGPTGTPYPCPAARSVLAALGLEA